jgi:hypothetical protein
VARELRGVRLRVGLAAGEAVFLVGKEDHADRAPRVRRHRNDLPRRLDRDAAARAVVDGSCAEVPGIEVRPEEHDLVGLLAADDLAHDVAEGASGFFPHVSLEAHSHGRRGGEGASKLGVGNRERRRGIRALPRT